MYLLHVQAAKWMLLSTVALTIIQCTVYVILALTDPGIAMPR